jgi:nicotinate-nucleotide pyrophosphorylase (carboxylating)
LLLLESILSESSEWKTIRDYALCGVDYISSDSLTHSVYNLDLSLKDFINLCQKK